MRLVVPYTQPHRANPAPSLDVAQLDAELISSFLDELGHIRQNTITSREPGRDSLSLPLQS